MLDMRMQESSDALGDDRDFFEEDFVPFLQGSVIELPEGHDVSLRTSREASIHILPPLEE